jgi:hypothetical protein
MLRRYWFTFDRTHPTVVHMGCGVTAFDRQAALALIQRRIFPDQPMPAITSVTDDVDIRTLEANHVRPNMGVPVWPGIWFPQGYQS